MDKYRDFFNEYVAEFDTREASIWRKHEHTFRVVDNSRAIAEDIGMSSHDIEVAELIGLFHDLGRFEQWRVYQNFTDAQTIDHADASVRVITENNLLDNHSDRQIILAAIANHNKFTIDPKITDDRCLTFCKIIRDADKLDIIRLFLSGKLVLPKNDKRYSRKALTEIVQHHLVKITSQSSSADCSLAELGLFNDINFEYTKRCIRQEQLIEKLIKLFIKSKPSETETFRHIETAIKSQF